MSITAQTTITALTIVQANAVTATTAVTAAPAATTLTVSVVSLPSVTMTSSGIGPVYIAIIGAILALCVNFLMRRLETRARHRNTIRNTISTLETYSDELRNGLDWIDRVLAELKSQQYPHSANLKLSRKSWDNFRLEAEYRTELSMLEDQLVLGIDQPIRTLPIHLKNCFEYITINHENTARGLLQIAPEIHTMWEGAQRPIVDTFLRQMQDYRNGYYMTVKLTEEAITRLQKKTTTRRIEHLLE